MSETNGAVRARKPQLADSIDRLDQMVDDLSVAIPGAVAESVREALGPAFAAAIKDAVAAAVAEALKEAGLKAATATPTPPALPPAPHQPRASVWTKVKAVLGRLRRWAAQAVTPAVERAVTPVLAHVAVGWAVAKCVGASTIRSRVAAVATAVCGVAAGLLGFVLGPVGAAALLALVTGVATAAAAWAAPAVRLFVALGCDE
jgi:hypothetical protein